MPTVISAILSIFSNVVSGVTEAQKEKIALELQQNQAVSDLLKAQAEINQTEAANSNLFVSGARPFIMWVCGLAFAWQYLLQPIVTYFFVISGHPMPPLPVFDASMMTTVLMGMLGLGGMRSWEKYQGVNDRHG